MVVVARRHALGSRVSVARGGHRLVEVTRVRVDRRAAMPEAVVAIIVAPRGIAPGAAIGIIKAPRAGAPSVVVAEVIADSFTISLAKRSPAWPSADFTGGQACC